ncbi:BA3454 family stress response protein [Bacillus sp. V5-8f]|nr:BA3454 family stress response protein [Bacillus sp. V5-8f]PLT33098.1 hypothetical protein CUU64_15035 [Bacillus sp. V5-8f]
MKEITVVVNLNGHKYQTNVVVNGKARQDEILNLAEEQVRKQWAR